MHLHNSVQIGPEDIEVENKKQKTKKVDFPPLFTQRFPFLRDRFYLMEALGVCNTAQTTVKVVSQWGLASGQDPKVNRENLKQTRILPHALQLIGAFLFNLVLGPQKWVSVCLC